MRNFFNYVLCSGLLFLAVALVLSGGWWSFVGLLWSLLVYISGDIFPTMWLSFWRSNMRIMRYFDCL